MTDYESQSLQIATNTLDVYSLGNNIAIFALIVITGGGLVAFFTLRKISQQLDSAKWNSLLSF